MLLSLGRYQRSPTVQLHLHSFWDANSSQLSRKVVTSMGQRTHRQRPYWGKSMVNKPLRRPYFPGVYTSHYSNLKPSTKNEMESPKHRKNADNGFFIVFRSAILWMIRTRMTKIITYEKWITLIFHTAQFRSWISVWVRPLLLAVNHAPLDKPCTLPCCC